MTQTYDTTELRHALTRAGVKEPTVSGLCNYVAHGRPVGGFLTAVLCNDLFAACARADSFNKVRIVEIVSAIYNFAPSACWGSSEAMDAWVERCAPKLTRPMRKPTRAELTQFLVDTMGYDEADLVGMPYEDLADGIDLDAVMAYVS